MKKKTLISSILTIALCLSLIAGSTFALFTGKSEVNVAVTAGKVDVVATVREGSLKTFSYDRDAKQVVEQPTGTFSMGGTAKLISNEIKLDKVVPGDKAIFTIDVENKSNVTVMYRTAVLFTDDTGLAEALEVWANEDQISTRGRYSSWQTLAPVADENGEHIAQIDMIIDFPYTNDDQNAYINKTCTVVYMVEAVQGNADIATFDENGFRVVNGVLEAISDEVYNAETVTIPEGVTELAESLFYGAPNLKTLVIPEGVKTIPESFCQNALNLESVVLPNTLEVISKNAFKCNQKDAEDLDIPGKLNTVNIPASVTEIGDGAFYNTALEVVTVRSDIAYGTNVYRLSHNLKSVIIEDGVTAIPEGMFRDSKTLETVVLPETVTSIANYAFRSCVALESVTILAHKLDSISANSITNFDHNNTSNIIIYVVNDDVMQTVKDAHRHDDNVKLISVAGEGENQSVAESVKNAKAGDILYVPAGTYTDVTKIPDGVTLIGAEGTQFVGSYRFYDNEDSGNPTENITVRNINFVSESGAAMTIIGCGSFIDCTFTGPGAVGYCVNNTDTPLKFVGCTLNATSGNALTFAESAGDIVIEGCVINGDVGFGFVGNITVSNTVFSNSEISCYSAATFDNCTFDTNSKVEICGNADIQVEINNCIVATNPMARSGNDILNALAWEKETEGEFVINGRILAINSVKLVDIISEVAENEIASIALVSGTYTIPECNINGGRDITISSYDNNKYSATFDGRFHVTATLRLENMTVTNANAASSSTSKISKVAIGLFGEGAVFCDNVVFDITQATGITSWWSTGEQTNVVVTNSTFNCNGNRPLQIEANATISGCTFNDQYRYSAQLTASNAIVTFNNNIIDQSKTSGNPTYGIQITSDYGNSNLTLNISGNTIVDQDAEDHICVWESGIGISNGYVDVATITVNGEALVESDLAYALDGWYAIDNDTNAVTYDHKTADTYYLVNKNGAVWFAREVNGGNKFSGKKVVLANDIDLGGIEWTPAGNLVSYPGVTFAGEFDGADHTIANMNAADAITKHATAGFFGSTSGAYIHDVTFLNPTVTSTHYAGVVVGYEASNLRITNIQNVTVIGATVITKAEQIGDTWDNGDKAGGLVGYATSVVIDGCTIKDSTVRGYRDIGGVIGYADGRYGAAVKNCTVENVTVACDSSQNYKNYTKAADFDIEPVAGEAPNNAEIANNTVTNVTVIAYDLVSAGTQNDFNNVFGSGSADNVSVSLGDGNYTLPGTTNKDVIISGSKDTVITINKPAYHGSNVTLNGVTVKGSGYSTGVQHVDTVTYNNVMVEGEMCLYGEKVVFNNCTFNLAKGQYIWTYGAAVVEFNNCTFNTAGKAILIYNEGAGASNVTVKGCKFYASAGDKAGAIANQNCAAIEIDNHQNSGTGAAHVLTTEGNTYGDNFSGEWRIKNHVSGNAVTVNGSEYTQIAIDGKLMTIDASKNVTVND